MGDFVANYVLKSNDVIQAITAQNRLYKELVFNVPSEVRAQIDSTKTEFFKYLNFSSLSIYNKNILKHIQAH